MNIADIKSPADIKGKSIEELTRISAELRRALITRLAAAGGHVGPNLGFLEATVALHYVFDAPKDKLVFDVSHQSYVHKMLTGRIEAFLDPAHYNDVTGYTNPRESVYDLFLVGHTSTAVSLASGLAVARDLEGARYNVVAVVGDGSLSGGEAFEGLDFVGARRSNFIVVVNDNQMSIAPVCGALASNLALLRATAGRAGDNYFKALGFDYIYVGEGNDLGALIDAFTRVKDSPVPVVVHLNTEKGMGLPVAEEHKEAFHYHGPFDPETGASTVTDNSTDYTDIFSAHMLARLKTDPTAVLLTAAVPGAIGFTPSRREEAGDRFIDVGIAEEQAVGMASGLAKGGFNPVVCEPATFLQRAYDQISQDVSINRQPVVFVTFYGGVYGMTDETHLGFFDVPMISNIPGVLFLEPTCAEEYTAMLDWAVAQRETPVVVRTPSAAPVNRIGDFDVDYNAAGYETVRAGSGDGVAIIAAGDFLQLGLDAAAVMEKRGVDATVINPRYVSKLDTEALDALRGYSTVITLEDNSVDGGFGQKVAAYLADSPVKVHVLGLPKVFANRYDAATMLRSLSLTPEAIAALA